MTSLAALAVDPSVDTFDARWNAWQARGRANDVRSHQHMMIVTILVAVATTATLIWTVLQRAAA